MLACCFRNLNGFPPPSSNFHTKLRTKDLEIDRIKKVNAGLVNDRQRRASELEGMRSELERDLSKGKLRAKQMAARAKAGKGLR